MTPFRPEADPDWAAKAEAFCDRFLSGRERQRFVLGATRHAASVIACVDIDGVIDDVFPEAAFHGKPVLRSGQAPASALVVSTILGKVWTAQRRLEAAGLEALDYYAFWKTSGLPVASPFLWDDFASEFELNRAAYEALHAALADETSRKTLSDIVNFRLTCDIDWMRDYADRQDEQYFEAFLGLRAEGETFIDVGAYDGFTSETFIDLCPAYARVHVFEPDPGNMALARGRLGSLRDIVFHPLGLSDRAQILRLSPSGSTSRIGGVGEVEVALDRLDAVIDEPVTFIKMDIEGAERAALDGAAGLIRRWTPRLALAAYHRAGDLRSLPAQVGAIAEGYRLYLRHYTEGRDETVLFFIPDGSSP